MIQTIAKWLIGRAAERQAPLPRWLRRWVDRDPALASYAAASRQLDELLRHDAPAWMARQTGDAPGEVRVPAALHAINPRARQTRKRAAWAGAACAAAASVLLAMAWLQSTHHNVPAPAAGKGRSLAVEPSIQSLAPGDRDQLIAVWQAGRTNVGVWGARLKDASRRLESIELRSPASIFRTVEFTGSAPQRVRRSVAAAVASQQHDLTAGVKSAYVFVAHRLPASVAILVGLQDG